MRRLRRTKIVATLGPASSGQSVIANLFAAGADVFRINMSHTSHERMRELVQQTTSGSTELAASAEQMSKMSRGLLESMDRFAIDSNDRSNTRSDSWVHATPPQVVDRKAKGAQP